MRDYQFTEERQGDGSTLLKWTRDGKPHYPLDFWFVPGSISVEEAMSRVQSGEFDPPA